MAESASSAPPESMHAASASSGARPRSAVSTGVGIVELAGLVSYLLIARFAPEIAAFLGIDWGSRGPMSGPNSATAGVLARGVPMVRWLVLIATVHEGKNVVWGKVVEVRVVAGGMRSS